MYSPRINARRVGIAEAKLESASRMTQMATTSVRIRIVESGVLDADAAEKVSSALDHIEGVAESMETLGKLIAELVDETERDRETSN